jgi:hypothetical protein
VFKYTSGFYDNDDNGYAFYQEIKIPDFTTEEDDTIYFQEAFPDENFRSVVVKAINGNNEVTVKDETIHKSDLESITYIYSNMGESYSKTTTPIKRIKGIELLTNLTDISLKYHEITDISEIEWKSLSKLKYLYLTGNDITSVPNFSANTELVNLYLDENLLEESTIADIEAPVNCYVYTDNQRVGGLSLVVEDNYYFHGDNLSIIVEPKGYKTDLYEDDIKFYLDGNEISIEKANSWSSYYKYDSTEISEDTHTIYAEITIGDKPQQSDSYEFKAVKQSLFTEKDKYYMSSTADTSLSVSVYTEKLNSTPQKAELINAKTGKVYAEDTDGIYTYTTSYDPRYKKVSYYNDTSILTEMYLGLSRLTYSSIPAGDYNIKITYADNNYDLLEKVVEVTTEAVITGIYGGYDYDETGDYIFLELDGSDIEPEQLNYTFVYNKKTYEATYVSSKPTASGVIVKLEKGKLPRMKETSVTVNITAKSGYKVKIATATSSIYLSTGVFWLAYNQGTSQFEAGISAILGRDETVEAELWSDYKDNNNAKKLATSSSKLNSDGIAYFTFVNDDGTKWVPTESKSYYVYCTYKGITDYKSTWVNRVYSSSGNSGYIATDYWDITDIFEGTSNACFWYYEGAKYNSKDAYISTITKADGNEVLATAKVGKSDSSLQSTQRVTITQQYDLSKLEAGTYSVNLKKNGELLSSHTLTILPNKFILTYISASWSDNNTIEIYLESPNYSEGDANNYVVTLTDPNGEEVSGLETTVSRGNENSYLELKVTGLNRLKAYKKYYVKIKHKKLGEAVYQDSDGNYVPYFTGKGEYRQIYYSTGGYYSENNRVTGLYLKDFKFPVKIMVFRPYDAQKIIETTVNSNYSYYFTKSEFYDKLPDKNDLYDIIAIDSDGRVLSISEKQIGYKGASSSTTNNWDYVIGSTDLLVDGTTTITVSGSNKTPTFKSSDSSVVSVAQDGYTATLTAKNPGKATITITANGSSKKVEISVSEAPKVVSAIKADKTDITVTTANDGNGIITISGDKKDASFEGEIVAEVADEYADIVKANVVSAENAYELAKIEVTGLKPGTAKIKVSVKDSTIIDPIEISVTVKGIIDPTTITKPSDLYLNATDTTKTYTLNDVKGLPEGWSWTKPNTKVTLDKLNPEKAQSFSAIYQKDGYEDYTQDVNVYLYILDAITVTGSNKIVEGDSGIYEIKYDIIGTYGSNTIDCEVTVSDGATYSKNGNEVTVTASNAGTVTLTVTPTINGTSVSDKAQTLNINVPSKQHVTDIEVKVDSQDIENGISNLDNGNLYVDIANIGKTIVLLATGTTNTARTSEVNLKWTSSDSSVAEITEEGSVTIKKAGTTNLKVTAEDDGNYSETIKLVVGDFAPQFADTKLTVYRDKVEQVVLPVYVNESNPINSVEIIPVSTKKGQEATTNLTCSEATDEGNIYISVIDKDKVSKKTTEKVQFKFETELGTYTSPVITATIEVTEPKATFKQSAKFNLFYSSDDDNIDTRDADVVLTVTSKNQIEDITLASEVETAGFTKAVYNGSTVSLWATGLNKDTVSKFAKTVALNITYKDLGTYTQTVTINTETKKPSLSINNASVLNGQYTFDTTIINSKTKEVASEIDDVEITSISKAGTLDGEHVNEGILTIDCSGVTSNVNYVVTVDSVKWTQSITNLKGRVTYVKTPTIVLGSKMAVLTNNTSTSKVSVSIKDYSGNDISAYVQVDKKSRNDVVNVYFDDENQSIVAELLDMDKQTKSNVSYTYTLNPESDGIQFKPVSFKVNVVKQNTTVTFKTKGTINLANANEYVTITPTLKNTTASVVSAELASAELNSTDYSEYFVLESLGNGTFKLTYDDEVSGNLEAKKKYAFKIAFTLDDGTIVTNDKAVTITPAIKLPTVKADVTKGTLYRSSDKAIVANLTTTSKTGSNPIDDIVILNSSVKGINYTMDELFNVDFMPNEAERSNGTVTISLTEEGKNNLKAGKYTVTCQVYYETGATSITPVNVKFTITVK